MTRMIYEEVHWSVVGDMHMCRVEPEDSHLASISELNSYLGPRKSSGMTLRRVGLFYFVWRGLVFLEGKVSWSGY